ncbi:hypothetical protein [Faecalimicrobium dakarense]|uniref:hypothetical protein n=1 Tax=Faecalimicrobium dakarense TaxID=1301100 RepID=UPI0004B034B7|nr:hypothetical protein [[Clostridium] dakarense]
MKIKPVLLGLLLVTSLSVGCSSAPAEEPKEETKAEETVDAVGTASLPASLDEFTKGIATDGKWIVTPVANLTSDKDLTVDGVFYNKDDKSKGEYRKLGFYAQDENKKVTEEYTLTVPVLNVKSPQTTLVNGTIKGDVFVDALGFNLNNCKIDGNLLFASEDIKADFEKVMAEKMEKAKADGKEMKEATELVTGEIKVK